MKFDYKIITQTAKLIQAYFEVVSTLDAGLLYFFRIEGKDMKEEWMMLSKECPLIIDMNGKEILNRKAKLTSDLNYEKCSFGKDEHAYMFMYILFTITKFFRDFGNEEEDKPLIDGCNAFFDKYKKYTRKFRTKEGFIDDEKLFWLAWPKPEIITNDKQEGKVVPFHFNDKKNAATPPETPEKSEDNSGD